MLTHTVSCPEMKRHCPLSDIEYFLDSDNDARQWGDKIAELTNTIEKSLSKCRGINVSACTKEVVESLFVYTVYVLHF